VTKRFQKGVDVAVVFNRFGKQLLIPAIEAHTLPKKFRRPSENIVVTPGMKPEGLPGF